MSDNHKDHDCSKHFDPERAKVAVRLVKEMSLMSSDDLIAKVAKAAEDLKLNEAIMAIGEVLIAGKLTGHTFTFDELAKVAPQRLQEAIKAVTEEEKENV